MKNFDVLVLVRFGVDKIQELSCRVFVPYKCEYLVLRVLAEVAHESDLQLGGALR